MLFENDAGTYFVSVYCDGPSEAARHDQFVIIGYGRLLRDDLPEGRTWVPVRKWTAPDGRSVRARSHDTHAKKSGEPNTYLLDAGLPHMHYQYRFRCARCGYDEQRNYGPAMDDIFDVLAENNIREIPVRAFVARAWG